MRVPAGERLLAVVGYLPFLPFWLIPVMARRDSMFDQFHGRQAGVLWGLWIAPLFLMFIVAVFVPSLMVGTIGPIYIGTMFILTGIYLLMSVIGIFKAMFRERYRMPVVADVALMLRL